MSKPYDAVTKRLIEMRPADWVRFLRLPPGEASMMDADLSTITAYADRIIRVDTPERTYLVHNELESGKDTAAVPLRLLHYNASALYKTQLPVVSTVFLLHKAANSPGITGSLEIPDATGTPYFTFRYNVVRIWQVPPGDLLGGGLSLLPFAPIANVRPTDVPGIIQTMRERIESESVTESEAGELWTATSVLMGLRYNESFRTQMLQGVRRMRESNTYQQILNEGRVEGRVEGELREARRILLRQGVRRLGIASPMIESRLDEIQSLDIIEALIDRVFEVETWDDLLSASSSPS